jgi:Na+-transporting NADH:ubiquinone oxidoreductase subunit A
MQYTIKRGLDVPIEGAPEQVISQGQAVSRVGIVGDDYLGMKPTMRVTEGDRVLAGQVLFEDKKVEGVCYTSPVAGQIVSVNRGEKRRFQSVVIERDGDEAVDFKRHDNLDALSAEAARDILLKSGQWVGLRTRPFSKVADPAKPPHSIFVTAIDTHPLAADPEVIIREYSEFFAGGLRILSKFTEGPIYVCKAPGASNIGAQVPKVAMEEFSGPHPSGLVGTHVHLLDPVGPKKMVWHIGYQDVIQIGHVLLTGRVLADRIVSLAGPRVVKPRLVRTLVGANLTELTNGELQGDNNRIVSGSILAGRTSQSPTDFLGRYHNQVSVLKEGNERIFLGWQRPGFDKFSVTRAFASAWAEPDKKFALTTSTEGSKRAMVPIGSYEKVMPLDILPTQLLRALISGDTDLAQGLGALELDEEDLALCTFVCPGKYEYGSILRNNLTLIEKEG